MRRASLVPYALGASAVLVLGFVSFGPGLGFEPPPDAAAAEHPKEHDGVLVLVVSDVNDLFALHDAIEPERIVADGEQAFAIREGRIVATSLEAASRPLSEMGWAERSLEIRVLGSLGRSGKAKGGSPPPEGSIAALARKPSLTIGEALGALKKMR